MTPSAIRVLGIDTSLRSTGVGIVETAAGRLRAVAYGRIRNRPSLPHSACLRNIYEALTALLEEHVPDCVAIEGAFFARNASTAMILGQARGAAIAACAGKGLEITEYSPRRVKQAVVGTGTARKQQVALMVARLLDLAEAPQEDAADALAIAICHIHHLALPPELRAPTI